MEYDFKERLNMSMQAMQMETDKRTLESYFPDVLSVRKTDTADDKSGIDYIVTLKSGVRIGVDVKTRDSGCCKYWKNGPELALETWSQKYPKESRKSNQCGWTVDSQKRCNYVMFKFDRADCRDVFIFPFQQLNKAFRHKMREWYRKYTHAYQSQKDAEYKSECIFVPAKVVIEAVKEEFAAKLIDT